MKDSIESYLLLLDEDIVEEVREKVELKEFYNTYKSTASYLKEKKRRANQVDLPLEKQIAKRFKKVKK